MKHNIIVYGILCRFTIYHGIPRKYSIFWPNSVEFVILLTEFRGNMETFDGTSAEIRFRLISGLMSTTPNLDEEICKMKDSKYFSTLDIASAFHQIKLNDADKEKTAFSVGHQKFHFKRMPFGLKGSPKT